MDVINQYRRSREDVPEMARIVVAIDPAGSAEAGANETGILVVAVGADGRGYVLDDYTMSGSPKAWADRALAAYRLHAADAIVAEVNYGGDMVA